MESSRLGRSEIETDVGRVYARIHATVRRIPRGRVATYGQIAMLAGLAGHARQVGYALSGLGPDSTVPWHRVVDAAGRVKSRTVPGAAELQWARLAVEGIHPDDSDRVSLERSQWRPRTSLRAP